MKSTQLKDQQLIGMRLLDARQAKGMTRLKVLALTGIPKLSLRNYERGFTGIPALRLKQLADAYGVTYEWLLTGRDSQVDSPEFQNAIASLLQAGQLIGDAGRLLQKVN